jgi:Holliday junction resolvase RusA-like endonuclease
MSLIELPSPNKLIVSFNIHPVPALRMTRGELKLKFMDERILNAQQISKKKKIQRYMDFKTTLLWEAKMKRFQIPHYNFWMVFFLQTVKAERWGQLHVENTPDTDNLTKALKDALAKKDHMIADYRASKIWAKEGKIEIYHL